jgi:hypothetical protein
MNGSAVKRCSNFKYKILYLVTTFNIVCKREQLQHYHHHHHSHWIVSGLQQTTKAEGKKVGM